LLGVLNLYVARQFTEATWVKFKMFGVLGLLVLFVVAQTLYLSRHQQQAEETKG
jgi:intracellular septation protein